MKKLITLLLLSTSVVFGTINVSSSFVEDQYHYDLDIALDFGKNIWASDFLHNAEEGTRLFYEITTIKPSESGIYTFNNYASDIAVGNTIVTETELLIYTDVPSAYIIDEPWAFRTSDYGFGAGYQSNGSETISNENLTGFTGDLYLEKDVEYIALFSSFVPDAYGTMDVSVISDYSLQFGAIPEPSTYALLFGWVAFVWVAIYQRQKSRK